MGTQNRLTEQQCDELVQFMEETANAWRDAGLVKLNSYGVEILFTERAGSGFAHAERLAFGHTLDGAEHDEFWYVDNAHGKNLISVETGLDSLTAIRLVPGVVAGIEGAFPWGGAVIDLAYGVVVGVSGFQEDEDILFAQTILARIALMLDRDGDNLLDDARQRGKQPGDAGADRFTKISGSAELKKTPAQWLEELHPGISIADPDGWRVDDTSMDLPLTRQDFERRLSESSLT